MGALLVARPGLVAAAAKRESTCVHRIQQVIEEAFIDAGLRDLVFAGEGSAQVKQGEDEPAPEIGWAVFDSFAENRRCQIRSELLQLISSPPSSPLNFHLRQGFDETIWYIDVLLKA